jgi:hypothetical protein
MQQTITLAHIQNSKLPWLLFLWGSVIIFSACTPAQPQASPFSQIVLKDVQPLWGGRNLYLWHDGSLYIQIVEQGQENRYATQITPEQVAELDSLLHEHNFAAIEIPDRPGLPDEAHPTITVWWQSGEHTSAAKWDTDTHPDFDAVYEWLRNLASEAVQEQTAVYTGTYDPDWQPPDITDTP